MNMQGFIVPDRTEFAGPREHWATRVIHWFWLRRVFLFVVALPTALLAGYYFLIAADLYESEAHFLVRSSMQQQAPGIGVAQALSAATGIGAAQSEEMSVADYLTSHDVVEALNRDGSLQRAFQRSEADALSRLRGQHPASERMLKYFRNRVSVKFNSETGITTLTVHAFQPGDARALAEHLLELGEARVNSMNERSYRDSMSMARRQLDETERALGSLQVQLTHFRQNRRDIDPQASGQAQIDLVSRLTAQLATARAQLNAMGRFIAHSSPQYLAMAERVHAFEDQLGAQSGRLTVGASAIAQDIGGYENLRMRQEFLTKRYEAAAAAVERARDQAQRQQLYVVRVVQPNLPQKALFPQRGRIVGTVFLGLILVYALGWLIVAGMKEHAV